MLPPEQVEPLRKGIIDGALLDSSGADIVFTMGGTVQYSTEIYSYVSSFGVAMKEDFWKRLPPHMHALVTAW